MVSLTQAKNSRTFPRFLNSHIGSTNRSCQQSFKNTPYTSFLLFISFLLQLNHCHFLPGTSPNCFASSHLALQSILQIANLSDFSRTQSCYSFTFSSPVTPHRPYTTHNSLAWQALHHVSLLMPHPDLHACLLSSLAFQLLRYTIVFLLLGLNTCWLLLLPGGFFPRIFMTINTLFTSQLTCLLFWSSLDPNCFSYHIILFHSCPRFCHHLSLCMYVQSHLGIQLLWTSMNLLLNILWSENFILVVVICLVLIVLFGTN